MKKTSEQGSDLLYESFLRLETVEECRQFLADLCTVSEIRAMEQRIEVAMRLRDGMIYQNILRDTGASSATISRVNRCIQYGAGGYETILPRLEAVWAAEKERES